MTTVKDYFMDAVHQIVTVLYPNKSYEDLTEEEQGEIEEITESFLNILKNRVIGE
jgi:hypothetical protein